MGWLLLPLALIAAYLALRQLHRYMVRVEPYQVEVSRQEVIYPDLPPELDGVTICQISDLHISAHPRNETAITEAVRSVKADLYVLTGDMVFMQPGVGAFFRWFDAVRDKLSPVVAVLGNAEHKPYVRLSDVMQGLAQRNVPVLNNERIELTVRGARMQIVGVDDPHTHHSDFARAFTEADPARWTLLLCHSPDGLTALQGHRADLVLCGHTHGGQVRLPLLGALRSNLHRVNGLVSGWYAGEELSRRVGVPLDGTRLYVSRGLGAGGFPGRLLCRPELPLFVLRRGTESRVE